MSNKNDIERLTDEFKGFRSEVSGKLDSLGTKIGDIDKKVSWWQGGSVAVGVLLAAAIVLVAALFPSWVDQRATSVFREEFRYRQTVVQHGALNAKNKVSDDPLAFDWTLSTPIDPKNVVAIQAETLSPSPGASLRASIIEGGTKCRMTLVARDLSPFLALLETGIPAKVTITFTGASD